MVWSDEDGNLSRGDGEYGKVGQQRNIWDGMLLSGMVGPNTLASAPTQATVAKYSRAQTSYILAVDETAGVPTSGVINLSWLGQSVACNWNQDATSLQALFVALNNVDIAEVVGGPFPNIPLLFRLFPTTANRIGSPANMTISSQSLNKGSGVLQQGLGYSGTTDTLTVLDPALESDSGSYCIYTRLGRGLLVPIWASCKGSD